MMIEHFINGKKVSSCSDTYDIYNPATGEIIDTLAMGSESEIDQAVTAAKNAFASWSKLSPLKRSRVLFKYYQLLNDNKETIAKLITKEHGKVYSDALGEVQRGIEVVEFACGMPQLLKGDFSYQVSTSVDCYSLRQPVGVCAGITPFNFPAMVPMWMFPIAVACGNTFILKPSEKDPSASMYLAELFKQAGLPDGVLNVVHGDKKVVDAILHHPDILAVSFVGSTPIAQYIYETAAKNAKRVQALGGAKNHCIVMPDANMDDAVAGLMGAAYGSAGERCMAISVAVAVGEETADNLINQLSEQIDQLKVAPGDIEGAQMGPVITKAHREKIIGYVDLGVKEGAKLVKDGRSFTCSGHENGFFVGPALFDQVTPDMTIYKEEIFGPVLCVVRVGSLKEAIQLINHNQYANGVAIYTRDGASAREFASDIQVGMVGVNIPIPVPMAFHSFGGWKNSLFGDMSVHGPEGVRFYTRLKTVTSKWSASQLSSDNQFFMPTLD
ncbi:MAG: CoA-acylating methylmalonate-semialdehyde dehydrogenase [Gammaproteobacteria bacterium]|nr:MAG: CoA-acylating methylmalonate-semialdehyde dehydrogenase [Gammaproteobacteria bacterium]UTW42165.1 CoA-acylating methylmalonate-semialdehyde dehydrogenase [bacterium SCSIO 12844]